MLWRASSLGDFGLEATDGAIGAIRDCLFDDRHWTIRWFVADTGTWLPGRKVLLAAAQVQAVAGDPPQLTLPLTREQVRASPPLEAHEPVSRSYEAELNRHYGAPDYWMGIDRPSQPVASGVVEREGHADAHLRSADEMRGYHIGASDGAIGHIEDFLLDADGWAVRYVVVGTSNWWVGKQVLLIPRAITGVSWGERTAEVSLTREQIRNGPEFDPAQTVDRAFEERYFGYYGYPVYW
jgi:hypothetical protein